MSAAHGRELVKKEAEREVVLDDLEGLTDQYQQLNVAFQSQAGKLAETKVCCVCLCLFPCLCASVHLFVC